MRVLPLEAADPQMQSKVTKKVKTRGDDGTSPPEITMEEVGVGNQTGGFKEALLNVPAGSYRVRWCNKTNLQGLTGLHI